MKNIIADLFIAFSCLAFVCFGSNSFKQPERNVLSEDSIPFVRAQDLPECVIKDETHYYLSTSVEESSMFFFVSVDFTSSDIVSSDTPVMYSLIADNVRIIKTVTVHGQEDPKFILDKDEVVGYHLYSVVEYCSGYDTRPNLYTTDNHPLSSLCDSELVTPQLFSVGYYADVTYGSLKIMDAKVPDVVYYEVYDHTSHKDELSLYLCPDSVLLITASGFVSEDEKEEWPFCAFSEKDAKYLCNYTSKSWRVYYPFGTPSDHCDDAISITLMYSGSSLIAHYTVDVFFSSFETVLVRNGEFLSCKTLTILSDRFGNAVLQAPLADFEMKETTFELLRYCNNDVSFLASITLDSASGMGCIGFCDVFVSLFSTNTAEPNPVYFSNVYLLNNSLFSVETNVNESQGAIWRLCNGESYYFVQGSPDDHVILETYDGVIHDSYGDYEPGFFTVSCSSINDECKLDTLFDFDVKRSADDKTFVSVTWSKRMDGVKIDVFNNGILVARSVDLNDGQVSFKLPKPQVENLITIREHCSHPVQTATSLLEIDLECYPPTIGPSGLERIDDLTEEYRISGVESYGGFLWVSINDQPGKRINVNPEKNDIVIVFGYEFDEPQEKYCISYSSCDENDTYVNLPCVSSHFCEPPTAEFEVYEYVVGSSLLFGFYYYGVFIHLKGVHVIAADGSKDIDMTPILDPDVSLFDGNEYELEISGDNLTALMGKSAKFVYEFEGCDGIIYTNKKEPFVFDFGKCWSWISNCTIDISFIKRDGSAGVVIRVDSNATEIFVERWIYIYLPDVTKKIPMLSSLYVVQEEVPSFINDFETGEMRFVVTEKCGGEERILKSASVCADMSTCEEVCDVFVSLSSTSFDGKHSSSSRPSEVAIDHDYSLQAEPYNRRGSIWHICNNQTYSLYQAHSNDRVIIETYDNVLYDSYGGFNDEYLTISCKPVADMCKLDSTFDFGMEQSYDTVTVTWNKRMDGVKVDIFDNGVLVAREVNFNDGKATFKLFRVQEGDEHSITIREHCSQPTQLITEPFTVHLPCEQPCELFMYEIGEFKNGYVNLTSENYPGVTYFAGAPSLNPNNPGLVSLFVCSGDTRVDTVLPSGGTMSSDTHRFVLVHNDTQGITENESGWLVADDAIVWDTSKDGNGAFEYVCVSCYPAKIANYSLVLRDDGNETLQLTGVKSYYGNVWISVNGDAGVEYIVDSDKNISIDFDGVREQYCFAHGTCNESIDQNKTICLDSLHCSSVDVNLGYTYAESECLRVEFEFDYFKPMVSLDYIKVVVDGSNESIDLTPDDISSSGKLVFNVTDEILKRVLDKNVCMIYSFSGCGHTITNSEEPLCVFLDKKSIVGLLVGCIVGGLAAAALLLGLIIFLIKRPRGENKEMSLEMEFPEDMEPVMVDDGPHGNPEMKDPETVPSPSPSGSESAKSESSGGSSSDKSGSEGKKSDGGKNEDSLSVSSASDDE